MIINEDWEAREEAKRLEPLEQDDYEADWFNYHEEDEDNDTD